MTIEIEQAYKDKGDTWPKMLKYNYEKYGDNRIAIRHKNHGIWQSYSWKDYYLNVRYLALGLLSLGFRASDKVVIIGDNAPEWYYTELAAQANHGVSVGVYPDLSPAEIRHIAENSEASFAVVQDQEQVDKLLEIAEKLPRLKKIIYWNYKGLAHYDNPILLGYRDVLGMGEIQERENPNLFEQNIETGKADDICALVYTSGTTAAAPKGVVHSYRTMGTGANYFLNLDPWYQDDNFVPHLPPVWMPEQWLGIGCHLLSANVLNFAEEAETQQEDMREIGPDVVSYGARVWESQLSRVQSRILDADVLKRFVFRMLMPIGYKVAELKHEKRKPNLFWKIVYVLANAALFRPIKDSLGLSNARICYNTGAVLGPDAFRFYHALNLPLKSLYWSTEGGATTGAGNDDIRLETVGPVHRGVEIKITENDEIICRQPGIFVGYYNDPARTAEVLKDGWFYSGDCGLVTEDGHVVFLDRMQNLVELANGQKLVPQSIESRLRLSPYIKDAWVLAGPDRTYTSAVIIINYVSVGHWAGQRKLTYANFVELSQNPKVCELVEEEIAKVNQALPPGVRVKKFVNLNKELDPDEAELTRNRRLKRAFLEERYRGLIDAIYSDKSKVTMEAQIAYQDRRTGKTKTTLAINSVEEAAQ